MKVKNEDGDRKGKHKNIGEVNGYISVKKKRIRGRSKHELKNLNVSMIEK